MSSDRDLDLKALLSAIMNDDEGGAAAEPEPEPEVEEMSAFGLRLSAAIRAGIDQMRADEILEVEDELVDALVSEVTEAGLEANSPKQLIKKVLNTLLQSERVEEIYGTDEMLKRTLSGILGGE